MVIIKYESESEVQAIVDAQTALGMHVIEVNNQEEGNFLGFDNRDVNPPTQIVEYSNQEIMDKQIATESLVMAVMSGVFDLYMK